MLADGDILGAGVPCRVVDKAEVLFGDLLWLITLGADQPEIVGAVPIADKSDSVAIRTEAGLHVPGQTFGQRPGFAAFDGQQEQVPEEIKHQLRAVRTDIEA